MTDSPLNAALRHFEAADANPTKAEKVLSEYQSAIPTGVAFRGDTPGLGWREAYVSTHFLV